jgi:hypothetical protein
LKVLQISTGGHHAKISRGCCLKNYQNENLRQFQISLLR